MSQTNTQIPVAESLADVSLRDLVAPLFRRKRLLMVTLLSIFTAMIAIFLMVGLRYKSHMAILVNRERLDPLVSTEATTQIMTASPPVTAEEVNS